MSNFWALPAQALKWLGRSVPAVAAGGALVGGTVYGAKQGYDLYNQNSENKLQRVAGGLPVQYDENDQPSMVDAFRDLKANEDSPFKKPVESFGFGPVAPRSDFTRKAYGEGLQAQANRYPEHYPDLLQMLDSRQRPGGQQTPPEAEKGGLPSVGNVAFKDLPVNFNPKDIEVQPLMTPEQEAEYRKFTPLDASGMDADLEALKARYAAQEGRQGQQIKDMEDRPYNVDLSPVMDLWKSWYGTDFGSYKRPEGVDERMARVYELRSRMENEGAQRQAQMFGLKSGVEGRKLDASKYNQETPKGLEKDIVNVHDKDIGNKVQAVTANNKNLHDKASMGMERLKEMNTNTYRLESLKNDRDAMALKKMAGGGKDTSDEYTKKGFVSALESEMESTYKDPAARAAAYADISTAIAAQGLSDATPTEKARFALEVIKRKKGTK